MVTRSQKIRLGIFTSVAVAALIITLVIIGIAVGLYMWRSSGTESPTDRREFNAALACKDCGHRFAAEVDIGTVPPFECPECGNRFRAGAKEAWKKEVNIKGVAEKIKDVEEELVNTLKNLREKIKTLEAERGNLLLEIEELKKMAEGKANALESEIGMLREEVKSLKHLLGVGEIDA